MLSAEHIAESESHEKRDHGLNLNAAEALVKRVDAGERGTELRDEIAEMITHLEDLQNDQVAGLEKDVKLQATLAKLRNVRDRAVLGPN